MMFITPNPPSTRGMRVPHMLKLSLPQRDGLRHEERSEEAISSILFLKFSNFQNLQKSF